MSGIPALDALEDQLVAAVARSQAQAARSARRTPFRLGAGGLVVAGLTTALVLGPPDSAPGGPLFSPTAARAAVTVTTRADDLRITFGAPAADPRDVQAALDAAGVGARVTFVPSSPSLVGELVVSGGSSEAARRLRHTYREGQEATGDVVALDIPRDVADEVEIAIGRRARPGELFTSSAASAAMPGEALHCVPVDGRVGDLLPGLAATGVVLRWRDPDGEDATADEVLDEYVNATTAWAPGEVLVTTTDDPPPAPSDSYAAGLRQGCDR